MTNEAVPIPEQDPVALKAGAGGGGGGGGGTHNVISATVVNPASFGLAKVYEPEEPVTVIV